MNFYCFLLIFVGFVNGGIFDGDSFGQEEEFSVLGAFGFGVDKLKELAGDVHNILSENVGNFLDDVEDLVDDFGDKAKKIFHALKTELPGEVQKFVKSKGVVEYIKKLLEQAEKLSKYEIEFDGPLFVKLDALHEKFLALTTAAIGSKAGQQVKGVLCTACKGGMEGYGEPFLDSISLLGPISVCDLSEGCKLAMGSMRNVILAQTNGSVDVCQKISGVGDALMTSAKAQRKINGDFVCGLIKLCGRPN
ncbi:unnamed protein product [Bursaphelenchus xylophilus]|uniref:(pine wood nematode) hypothetical protein n=1 Tax=Bursaphelenchus xylophilus TaxID=6326 RepID=A0A1I7S1J6_BURXY|nr:unnamed protein product [Bursaphelenchus xylophilus]CAG9081399.1 unnamed protein product [Bursaphelenchus xylophilus]